MGASSRQPKQRSRRRRQGSSTMWAAVKAKFASMMQYLRSLFWKQEMEITLVGLQNAGKSTLVNVIASGCYVEDMIPTVGFNMRKVTKGKVTIKMWDLGGQPRFRGMWERYCSNVSAIVYVVDGADHKNVDISYEELHELLGKPALKNIPLLVLGNKRDLPEALPEEAIIERMHLKDITDREVGFYTISAKNQDNIETTIEWLINHNQAPK